VAFVVQPTFLYELIWNLLVFVALIYVDRRCKLGHGRLFAVYVAAYCVGRFCVELLRDDFATHIAGIRINSFTSTFVFIGAVVYIILAPKGREDPETLRGTYYVPLEPEPAPELASVAAASAATPPVAKAVSVAGVEDSTESFEADHVAEADYDEPETVQTEVAEAEVAEPEVVEPEVAEQAAEEPEAAEPEAAEAEAQEPEGAEAEVEEPAAEEPEAEEPEAAEAEVQEPEVAEPQAAEEPEVAELEAAEAEAQEPEVDEPATAEPETEESVDTEDDLEADEGQPEESAEEAAAETTGESDVEAQDGDEQPEPAEQPVTVAEEEAEPTRRRWGFGLRNRRGR
jgi:hypothetical protein